MIKFLGILLLPTGLADPDPHGSVSFGESDPHQGHKPDPDPQRSQNSGALGLNMDLCRGSGSAS
jgi:hypothetical protein